ncbi:MAG: HEAT repeat domain-containing protein [Myxococcales bacterium]|nr:HEAT repeat domain-containing protein [Myxococcales bacterium]
MLVGLIQSRPNLKVYRKLLIELYHLQVTDILGRYPSIDAARNELRKVGEQGIAVLKEALTHQDVRIRSTAIDVLRHTASVSAASALVRALESPDALTRFQAAIALGEIGDEVAVAALVKKLSDSKYEIRRAVVWALGQIHHESASKALVRMIREGAIHGDLRALAYLGLGNQGGREAIDALLLGLRSTGYNDKVASALALGHLKVKRALEPLLSELTEGNSWRVRKVVFWALGRLADPRAFDALVAGLWDTRSELREIAGWALLRLSPIAKKAPSRSYRQMLRSFVSFHDGRLFARYDYLGLSTELIDARPSHVVALIRRFEKPLVRVLRKSLQRGDEMGPRRAMELLDFGGAGFSLGVLTAVVPHPEGHTELQQLLRRVVLALKAPLEQLATNRHALVREQAVQLLGKLTDPSTRPLFVRLSRGDSSANVRRAAIRALLRYGDRSVLAMFDSVLQKPGAGDWQLKASVARTLGALRWREAVPLLGKLLRDDVFLVRAEALESLLKIGGVEGKSVISSALRSTSKSAVVLEIIAVIADRRLDQYTAELRRLSRSEGSSEVRDAARAALDVLLQRPLQHKDI